MRRSFPAAELQAAAGARPIGWTPVAGGGYGTNTRRWRVELTDGRSAFVKMAVDDVAAGWLRDEHRVYAAVVAPFMPELVGWHDESGRVLLVLEDLTNAHWPPPWRPGQIEAALETLDAIHATRPPDRLPRLEDLRESLNGWETVAADAAPLLSTGLCSREWLDTALPTLRAAAETCELAGDSLLHLDFRSDNLSFRERRVVVVDWNLACVGNPLLDVVAWLPSLRLEGGPEPWKLVPDSGGLAALIAGFFAARAGLPPPATAPRVREFQRRQAAVSVPWAALELGLAPPG